MDKCPFCGAKDNGLGESVFECGTLLGLSGRKTSPSPPCRIRQAVAYLSKFTTPGSVTENHSLANRAVEILTGESREYR